MRDISMYEVKKVKFAEDGANAGAEDSKDEAMQLDSKTRRVLARNKKEEDYERRKVKILA
jgi:hypothetical protein